MGQILLYGVFALVGHHPDDATAAPIRCVLADVVRPFLSANH